MEQEYIVAQQFDKVDFAAITFAKGEYERCSFTGCNLANADLSGCIFAECVFTNCNLSLAKLNKTALREVQFTDCKMLGLQFGSCNPFGLVVRFENCQLNNSSFYQVKLKNTLFRQTQLCEADFTEADLTEALFDNCDLGDATFDHTILEKADLRNAYNYAIDPTINKIKKAKFSLNGIAGLLQQYDIEIIP